MRKKSRVASCGVLDFPIHSMLQQEAVRHKLPSGREDLWLRTPPPQIDRVPSSG